MISTSTKGDIMSDFATTYANAVESIAREDGLTEIQEILGTYGIESTVEQTGGMCMVLFVRNTDGSLTAVSRDGRFIVADYASDDAFYDGDEFKYAEVETVHEVIDFIRN
jgi:hypothetical protein